MSIKRSTAFMSSTIYFVINVSCNWSYSPTPESMHAYGESMEDEELTMLKLLLALCIISFLYNEHIAYSYHQLLLIN